MNHINTQSNNTKKKIFSNFTMSGNLSMSDRIINIIKSVKI